MCMTTKGNETMSNQVTKITVTRFEGPTAECDKPQSFTNFADANRQLAEWSRTAPEGGAYDKIGFVVEVNGEESYRGRYDLTHNEQPSLVKHIFRFRDWARNSGHVSAEGREAIDFTCDAILAAI